MSVVSRFATPSADGTDAENFSGDALTAQCVCEISSRTAEICQVFFKSRHQHLPTPLQRKKAMEKLADVAEWAVLLLYLRDIEVMEIDSIEEYADQFEDTVQNDGVLGCMNLQSAISNFAIEYYNAEDAEEMSEESYEQSIAEVFASICMIAQRLEYTFLDVIARTFD